MSYHPRITERTLQDAVVECAQALGWRIYHPWLSLNSADGYPDLTLVRGGRAGAPARLLFAELKSASGKLSGAQSDWLAALRDVPGVEVHVWTPAHWYDGTVEGVLR